MSEDKALEELEELLFKLWKAIDITLPEILDRVEELEQQLQAARVGLKDIASLDRGEMLSDPDYWGNKVVGTADKTLQQMEGAE